jgi:hypothetical protein
MSSNEKEKRMTEKAFLYDVVCFPLFFPYLLLILDTHSLFLSLSGGQHP